MKHIRKALFLCLAVLLLAEILVPCAQAAANPIRIAFIDSGISTKHVDRAKVERGLNYVFPESDTEDRIGHGTATAGLVLGAADQGVSGVFPDAIAVPLVVVDAYPTGVIKNGGPDALCQAIYDAIDQFHCQIINISLCTTQNSAALRAAAAYAEEQGVLLIAAIGNDGEDGRIYYPAAYPTVLSVGSAEGDSAAVFSQRGADLLAEGVELPVPTNKNGARPTTVQGTSYSCAVVSGICARLLARHPTLTPERVREALCAFAEDILEPGFDAQSGWGILPTDLKIPASSGALPTLSEEQLRQAANVKKIESRRRLRPSHGRSQVASC